MYVTAEIYKNGANIEFLLNPENALQYKYNCIYTGQLQTQNLHSNMDLYSCQLKWEIFF